MENSAGPAGMSTCCGGRRGVGGADGGTERQKMAVADRRRIGLCRVVMAAETRSSHNLKRLARGRSPKTITNRWVCGADMTTYLC